MFQEIEPYTYCNDFAWVSPESTDRVLIYRGAQVLVATDAEGILHFPSYRLLKEQGLLTGNELDTDMPDRSGEAGGSDESDKTASAADHTPHTSPTPTSAPTDAPIKAASDYHLRKSNGTSPEAVFLFSVGQTAYFRCTWDESQTTAFDEALTQATTSSAPQQAPTQTSTSSALSQTVASPNLSSAPNVSNALEQATSNTNLTWQFMPISELHRHAPRHRAFAGLVGYTYHTWYDTRRFCGRCGTPLVHDEIERMMRCPQCGLMEFPKLFPAVIVGIVDKQHDRVLVSRYANREYKRYALIAGFSEMGETVEQTVHREVMEEVGLHVKNLRYYKSQPWPPSSSLLFGFFCELDGENSITLDEHELEHAEWLPREDLPREDANYSLTRDMMQVLRERRETRYPISGQSPLAN